MVEINNQRKAFLDMLAWSEGTDNGRQKTRNHGAGCHCRRRANIITWSPQTCHAKPKTQINRRRTLPAFFPVGGMPTASSLAWKTSLRKVRTLWHCSRLRSVALNATGSCDIRQAPTVAAISGLHLPWAPVMVTKHKADSLIAKFKEAGGTVRRDWCMSRVTAIISALVICIIVCPTSGPVNYYCITPLPTKPSATNARELKLWTRQLLTCRCVSVMLLRSMQNTRRS